jgi:hypothetical protein
MVQAIEDALTLTWTYFDSSRLDPSLDKRMNVLEKLMLTRPMLTY